LEENIHREQCPYCSSESALTAFKVDSNNNQFEQMSLHSVQLVHAVELYLSANNSLNELADQSSISWEQATIISEGKQLSLCEINEIIYAIHTDSDDTTERNETLDALAMSLRDVAEEMPFALPDDDRLLPNINVDGRVVQPELGQVLARTVMYEIVMRLFSFYLLTLVCYARLF
jgi:hypothetical protein